MRNKLKERAAEYIGRAEHLKKLVEEEKKKTKGYHEQIVIEEDAVGFGLEKVFLPYIDSDLTEVELDDPYIRANHQVCSFCVLQNISAILTKKS